METYKYNELALLIQRPTAPDHFLSSASSTWKVEFISVGESDTPRNISDGYEYSPELRGYQDLILRTHLFGDRAAFFHWSICYSEIYSAETHDLERRLKTLKALDAKLAKVSKHYGSAQSHGEFVAQVMLAAKIKRALILRSGTSSTYDECKWHYLNVSDARRTINNMAAEWHEANDKKESAA